jgi:peptide/nickel transport system ATP-binding protein
MAAQIFTETPRTTSLLSIRDLRVAYRGAEALHGVSVDVRQGETVAIVGESGSGKSTTAQSIIGLLSRGGAVTGGQIIFDGTDLTKASPAQMRKVRGSGIGLIPQDPMLSLNPVIKVGAQVAEVLRIHTGISRSQAAVRAVELLADAGIRDPKLTSTQYPHQLSGGMRQRVLISIAIACNPKLIIADEPTSALDVTVQRNILDHIETISAVHGTSVLLITHDLGVAADRAGRIVVMNKGLVVEQGESDDILARPADPYTRKLIAAAPSMGSVQLFEASRAVTGAEVPLLSVSGISKTFHLSGATREFKAVDDVSFAVPRGETLAIVGESGSGKSTTARMVVRLEDTDTGSIVLDGTSLREVTGKPLRQMRKRFQMVYQDPFGSLNPKMSIGSVLEEPMRIHNVVPRPARKKRVLELLDLVSLPAAFADRKPRELSGGQRQRVAIARALSVEPELIVCDEPVSALDVSVQAQILDLLVRLQREQGITYLFISHDLAVVRQIAHRVVVMQKGKIVEQGSTADIFANPQNDYTRELLAAIPGSRVTPAALSYGA